MVKATSHSESPERIRLNERFTSAVCRRAFSSPEAAIYEGTIAPALCRIVARSWPP
jgi:hypothetical protein